MRVIAFPCIHNPTTHMSIQPITPAADSIAPAVNDDNQLIMERREKLKAQRQRQAEGGPVAFPNDVKPQHRAAELFAAYDS